VHDPANPYRVLAHAIDAGDVALARLLAARLAPAPAGGGPSTATGPGAVVERLLRTLGLG